MNNTKTSIQGLRMPLATFENSLLANSAGLIICVTMNKVWNCCASHSVTEWMHVSSAATQVLFVQNVRVVQGGLWQTLPITKITKQPISSKGKLSRDVTITSSLTVLKLFFLSCLFAACVVCMCLINQAASLVWNAVSCSAASDKRLPSSENRSYDLLLREACRAAQSR